MSEPSMMSGQFDIEEIAKRHWQRLDKINSPKAFGPHRTGDCYEAEVDIQRLIVAYNRLAESIEEVNG